MKKAHKCFGIKAKNPQQEEAIKALLDPYVDLVILDGVAGSGKTLLAVAAGLEQVLETKQYKDILFTRAPVGIGQDMGFLPGTEEEKMGPWVQGLHDNLEYLLGDSKLTQAVIDTKVKVRAMMFMRGRSLMNKWLIIDEVQNISVTEIKTLLTRAGSDTKVVIMGDSSQVDNKRLSTTNNALYYVTQAAQSTEAEFVKYVHLPAGERSRLCEWSVNNL